MTTNGKLTPLVVVPVTLDMERLETAELLEMVKIALIIVNHRVTQPEPVCVAPQPGQRLHEPDLNGIYITFEGERMTASDAAALVGLKPKHVVQRVNTHGWTISQAATTPLRSNRTSK